MTLVAAWIDWTNQNRPRLLCFADSRITNSQSGAAITDHSAKLFRLAIVLHRLKDFDLFNGTLAKPYFQTAIGVGYSGDLILADTVTSILSQTLPNLVIETNSKPTITWLEICSHIQGVLTAVLSSYVPIVQMATTFLVFGHFESLFKVSRISISVAGGFRIEPVDLYDVRHVSIGSGVPGFDSRVDAAALGLREELSVAKRQFHDSNEATRDECEVKLALARSKVTETLRREFANELNNGNKTVGGTMQLMEVTPTFIAIRKTGPSDILGASGVEKAGRFQALIVSEHG